MNIRVDLNTPIKDGTEVVFRSPVDCSQITGLIVYYPENGNTTSQEFMLADANGNNVGDIDHLFAENVAVKVILDVTTSMAFVQNADTNAYLENMFNKGLPDKLCPSFTESSNVAVCEPLEGYPLNVVSTISAAHDGTTLEQITLTQCGKNLFDFQQGVYPVTYTTDSGNSTKNGYAIRLPAGTYTLSVDKYTAESKTKYIYGCVCDSQSVRKYKCYLVTQSSFTNQTVTIKDGDIIYIYDGETTDIGTSNKTFGYFDIQIEAGEVATAYEPYCGQTYTANFTNAEQIEGKGFYNWNTGLFNNGASDYQHDIETGRLTMIDSNPENTIIRNIPAVSGTNRFYSDCGNTTVSGRADPVTIIEKLTNAILALGGNV